jgi:hypothetical protein
LFLHKGILDTKLSVVVRSVCRMSTGDAGNGATSGSRSPHAAVTAVYDVATSLADVAWWRCDDVVLTDSLLELERVARKVEAARLAILARVDARGSTAELGATSTAAWLRTATGAHFGKANAEVKLSLAVGRYPQLNAALAAGTISAAQLEACVKALDALPATTPVEKVAQAEAFLIEQCALFDPAQLAKLGKHLLHVMDPDGPELLEEEEQQAARSRELRITECAGGVKLRGFLDTEAAATVMSAIGPLSAPSTGADLPGGRDTRPAAQRRADALVELARRALNAGDLPVEGAERPHVTVTMDLATLMAGAHAFGGQLDRGGPLSAEAARRICCDAKVIPVVLGGASQPLDVGRETRTVPRHLRRAVVARDGGCAFPGCDRLPAWCEAHHVQHWSDGGPTCLSNLVLLCKAHHDVIHHTPWRVHIDSGSNDTSGRVRFTAPDGTVHQSAGDLRRAVEQLAVDIEPEPPPDG